MHMGLMSEFKTFINRGNVMDLAVGVIIGGVILFGDKVNPVQAGFMAMIVIGVAGTKLFGQG